MLVTEERNNWRYDFEDGKKLSNPYLDDYRKNRNNGTWRLSRSAEQLCEYILYLEDKLEK